jgi:DNA-binding CsgD family transcriptional regulator
VAAGDPPRLRGSRPRGDRRRLPLFASAGRGAGSPPGQRFSHSNRPAFPRSDGAEAEVLTLLGQGLPNREIAERLYLSPRTVERHIANLTVKAGVQGRSELIAFAART